MWSTKKTLSIFILAISFPLFLKAQDNLNNSDFKQLHEELPTPNVYRTASGAPGHEYYQQKADYQISVILDEKNHTIKGDETITYTNNSPDALDYLWLQLDQNIRAKNSLSQRASTNSLQNSMSFGSIKRMHNQMNFDGGFKIEAITNDRGEKLSYVINETMMRIDLPRSLRKGQSFTFKINLHMSLFSSTFIPAIGSSSKITDESVARARPNSTFFCNP